MNVAVILAGGVGSRVGAAVPKQFVRVFDKPVLAYTLEIFERNPNIDAIEIVAHEDWLDEVQRIVKDFGITKMRWICQGGKTFQESVMNGVFNLKGKIDDEDILVISFGVSPLTPQADIDDSIRVCKKYGNAIASVDLYLSTCIKDDEKSTTQNILRESLKGFSNPWAFRFGEILAVYEQSLKEGLIEKIEPHTTSLYFALGKPLYFSQSTGPLAKITTQHDLKIFAALLALEKLHEGFTKEEVDFIKALQARDYLG